MSNQRVHPRGQDEKGHAALHVVLQQSLCYHNSFFVSQAKGLVLFPERSSLKCKNSPIWTGA